MPTARQFTGLRGLVLAGLLLTAAGLGWSLLPTTMLSKNLLPLETGLTLQRELGLVLHRKRSLSNAANAMRRLIEQSE